MGLRRGNMNGICIIDDQTRFGHILFHGLGQRLATDIHLLHRTEADEIIDRVSPGIVAVCLDANDLEGVEMLERMALSYPDIDYIVVSDFISDIFSRVRNITYAITPKQCCFGMLQMTIENLIEKKRLKAELEEYKIKYQIIFENSWDGISIYERFPDRPDRKIVDCNENYARLAGRKKAELLKMNDIWKNQLGAQTLEESERMRKKILDNEVYEGEFSWIRPDNIENYIKYRAIPYKIGHRIFVCGFDREITRRKLAEKEVELKQEQLVQADKMASLGMIASGIAHEINNPNNYILANAQLLQKIFKDIENELDKTMEINADIQIGGMEYSVFRIQTPVIISMIIKGARRISNIVDEYRKYVRQSPPEFYKKIDINDVVRAAVHMLTYMINRSTDYFSFECDDHIPQIYGNFQRLEQVIINVIQNACQALSNRKQRITIQTGYEEKERYVWIRCTDEGRGMPEDTVHQVTEPFFTTKQDIGGTGLGLYISSRIIKEHQGKLNFNSKLNNGTQVTIKIPQDLKRESEG